jgi:hypothetical protein
MTDKLLTLKFGNNEKNFHIKLVSDAKATEADITQYITATKAMRREGLTKKEASKMRRMQDDLVNNYIYTTTDIETNLNNKRKKGQSAANLGFEQTKAQIALQAARAELDEAKHQLEIAAGNDVPKARSAVSQAERVLREKIEAEKIVLDKMKNRRELLTSNATDKKWAKVNKRAVQLNQKSDLGALKMKEAAAEAYGTEFNPYARRKGSKKILWEVGQKDDETKEGEEKESAAPKESNQETVEKVHEKTPSLVQEHQEKAAALSQSHQFAIDEEVLAMSSFTNGISGLTAKKAGAKRVRTGLSLSEYQERKAAGTL